MLNKSVRTKNNNKKIEIDYINPLGFCSIITKLMLNLINQQTKALCFSEKIYEIHKFLNVYKTKKKFCKLIYQKRCKSLYRIKYCIRRTVEYGCNNEIKQNGI